MVHFLKKNSGSKSCNLCLLKKLVVSNFKEERLLHKWLNLVSKCRHENKYINELLINSQTHYNLIVIFICNVFCIYKKLLEKINITSEGLSTQRNFKSQVFNCLTNIVIYSFALKYWALWNNCTFIRNNNK